MNSEELRQYWFGKNFYRNWSIWLLVIAYGILLPIIIGLTFTAELYRFLSKFVDECWDSFWFDMETFKLIRNTELREKSDG